MYSDDLLRCVINSSLQTGTYIENYIEHGKRVEVKMSQVCTDLLQTRKELAEAKEELKRAINQQDTYCAYCSQRFPLDDPESPKKVAEHIATCSKHPMRKVEAELTALREQVKKVREAVDSLRNDVNYSRGNDFLSAKFMPMNLLDVEVGLDSIMTLLPPLPQPPEGGQNE